MGASRAAFFLFSYFQVKRNSLEIWGEPIWPVTLECLFTYSLYFFLQRNFKTFVILLALRVFNEFLVYSKGKEESEKTRWALEQQYGG